MAAIHQVGQGALEGLHAVLAAGLQLRIDLGCFAFANQVRQGRGVDHDFLGHHAAKGAGRRIEPAAEGLSKHGHQAAAELHADLGLLLRRKHIHHAIHRLRC